MTNACVQQIALMSHWDRWPLQHISDSTGPFTNDLLDPKNICICDSELWVTLNTCQRGKKKKNPCWQIFIATYTAGMPDLHTMWGFTSEGKQF